MFAQEAAQAEYLAVGGGELRLKVADRGAPGVTFVAELAGEDVHDVVLLRGCGLCRVRLAVPAVCWARSFSMRCRRSVLA